MPASCLRPLPSRYPGVSSCCAENLYVMLLLPSFLRTASANKYYGDQAVAARFRLVLPSRCNAQADMCCKCDSGTCCVNLLTIALCDVQAILSYFDIVFEAGCETPVIFSTGPDVTPTHWKQTVFYLSHPLSLEHGDVIEGKLVCKRSAKNQRGLHVVLEYKARLHTALNGMECTCYFLTIFVLSGWQCARGSNTDVPAGLIIDCIVDGRSDEGFVYCLNKFTWIRAFA